MAKKTPVRKTARPSGNGHVPRELVRKVRAGLSFRELDNLRRELGLPLDQFSEKLGISRATLHRRKVAGRLGLDESDKVLRFARLARLARHVFGSGERARLWLTFPQWGLGGAVPLDYARSEVGARAVETLLGQIEYSVYS